MGKTNIVLHNGRNGIGGWELRQEGKFETCLFLSQILVVVIKENRTKTESHYLLYVSI